MTKTATRSYSQNDVPSENTSFFRHDLKIFPPKDNANDRRYVVYDVKTDLSYFLGRDELLIAKMFDGHRNLEQIAKHIKQTTDRVLPLPKLSAYEYKLIQLGLLSNSAFTKKNEKNPLDPAIGISYGPLKRLFMVPILRMDSTRMLDLLYKKYRWLCSIWFALIGILVMLGAIALLFRTSDVFLYDVKNVYGTGASWLLWHYPIIVLSIFAHEIGHALTCRHYKVRITDFGIAVYFLLSTGWARPLQSDWNTLRKKEKLISIAMGPYGSLLFASVGVFIWYMASTVTINQTYTNASIVFKTLGLVMAVSSTVALIPTLLPMFNGDTYLAITELLGIPRLRQRAFYYTKNWLKGKKNEDISSRRKVLYGLTVMGTLLGWLIAWFLLAKLVIIIYQWFLLS